jgi:hypothetical protein
MKNTKVIEIHGNENEVLSIQSRDILSCIEDGYTCHWSILLLEATGHINGKSMTEFEKDVKSSKNGMLLEWGDLKDLLNGFDQIIELILIGDKDQSRLKRYDTDEEMYSNCQYTIELVDSSYWVIHAVNTTSLDLMKKNLSGAR